MTFRILGLSGSLRVDSANSTLIRLAASLPDPEVGFEIYRGLGGLPFFSPERDDANASREAVDPAILGVLSEVMTELKAEIRKGAET